MDISTTSIVEAGLSRNHSCSPQAHFFNLEVIGSALTFVTLAGSRPLSKLSLKYVFVEVVSLLRNSCCYAI